MKLSIVNKNIRAYFGKADDEDEILFVLNGLMEYECNNLIIEFSADHPILEVLMGTHIEDTFGLRYDASHSGKNIFVFGRR